MDQCARQPVQNNSSLQCARILVKPRRLTGSRGFTNLLSTQCSFLDRLSLLGALGSRERNPFLRITRYKSSRLLSVESVLTDKDVERLQDHVDRLQAGTE